MSSSAGAQTQPSFGGGGGGGGGGGNDFFTGLFGGPRAIRNAQAHQMRMQLIQQQLAERQQARQEELAGKQTFGRTMLLPESGGQQQAPSQFSPGATPGALSPVPMASQKGLPLGSAQPGGQSDAPETGVKAFVRRMKVANPNIGKHPEAVANAMQIALPFMNAEEASYWRRIADQRSQARLAQGQQRVEQGQQRVEQGQQRVGVATTRENRLGDAQEFREGSQASRLQLDQGKAAEAQRHNLATEGATQQRIELSRERFKESVDKHQKTFQQAAERIANARTANEQRTALAALRQQQSAVNVEIANTARLMMAGASKGDIKAIQEASKAQQDAIDAAVSEILSRAQQGTTPRGDAGAGGASTPPAPAGSQDAPASSAPEGFTPPQDGAQVMEEARDAIERGAPREKVLERLRQQGIDPSGL